MVGGLIVPTHAMAKQLPLSKVVLWTRQSLVVCFICQSGLPRRLGLAMIDRHGKPSLMKMKCTWRFASYVLYVIASISDIVRHEIQITISMFDSCPWVVGCYTAVAASRITQKWLSGRWNCFGSAVPERSINHSI